MNAACFKKMSATAFVTSIDSWPSGSSSSPVADFFDNGAAAFSNTGRKLSLWKENKASTPLKTSFLSDAGTTVSLPVPTPLRILTGAELGLM